MSEGEVIRPRTAMFALVDVASTVYIDSHSFTGFRTCQVCFVDLAQDGSGHREGC